MCAGPPVYQLAQPTHKVKKFSDKIKRKIFIFAKDSYENILPPGQFHSLSSGRSSCWMHELLLNMYFNRENICINVYNQVLQPLQQARKLQATLVRVQNYDRLTDSLTEV